MKILRKFFTGLIGLLNSVAALLHSDPWAIAVVGAVWIVMGILSMFAAPGILGVNLKAFLDMVSPFTGAVSIVGFMLLGLLLALIPILYIVSTISSHLGMSDGQVTFTIASPLAIIINIILIFLVAYGYFRILLVGIANMASSLPDTLSLDKPLVILVLIVLSLCLIGSSTRISIYQVQQREHMLASSIGVIVAKGLKRQVKQVIDAQTLSMIEVIALQGGQIPRHWSQLPIRDALQLMGSTGIDANWLNPYKKDLLIHNNGQIGLGLASGRGYRSQQLYPGVRPGYQLVPPSETTADLALPHTTE